MSKTEEIALLKAQNVQLKYELDNLKRMVFGTKSERFVSAVPADQLALLLGDATTDNQEETKQIISYARSSKKTNKHQGRLPIPEHLPRKTIQLEPKEDTSGMRKIGEEITEELEYKPGKLFVNKYVRPKYVRTEENDLVLIADLPTRPIDKGIAGPMLLAYLLVSKYIDHLPLYRQVQIFKREGVIIADSTIGGWITKCADLLEPLYQTAIRKLKEQEYLQVDETPIQVVDPKKKGKTHRGYFWVYNDPLGNQSIFVYHKGRSKQCPENMLTDFHGFLQTDGYKVYDSFGLRPEITLMHCMAHARRYFEKALDNDKVRAEYALSRIQKLYIIERQAKGLSHAERKTLRVKEASPIIKDLQNWMLEEYPKVLPKSKIGEAINYALSRWDKLGVYLQDGKLEIDNNLVENSIRPVALGRKNYLFAGSHEAAQRSAIIYSLLGMCKKQEVNPLEWLADVLTRIPDHNIQKLHELLPQNWKISS